MSLFLPSQLSPNFEEVIEGNNLEFRFLVNTKGSDVTSYKLEILNENNDAQTPEDNILYTQRGVFETPLHDQDEGLIAVGYDNIKNILKAGNNYRWRVRLYDTQVLNNGGVPVTSAEDVQSECLTYMGTGNLVGTTKNTIWLSKVNPDIQEESFAGVYLQSNDSSNDFNPFIGQNQFRSVSANTDLHIMEDDNYCWVPAAAGSIGEIIVPNYQDRLFDGNMYLQIINTPSIPTNVNLCIPRKILTSFVQFDESGERHLYFGIDKSFSLKTYFDGILNYNYTYTYKLVYIERQQVYSVTQSIGVESLTKVEVDKPFTYNILHGNLMDFGLVNNKFYANKLYIHPVDEFDSKDIGNVYLIYAHNLDGLLETHYVDPDNTTYYTFDLYSQNELERKGAKKIINYVADTGEITLFSNLDIIPDLFAIYQIFTIDKTQSDYATNPQYKLLTGAIVYYIGEEGDLPYGRHKVLTSQISMYGATFKSPPYYLGGSALKEIGDNQYIYNVEFTNVSHIIDGTYLSGNTSLPVYSNHFQNVGTWPDENNSYKMLTYRFFISPNQAAKEDFYAPCVLNLQKTIEQKELNVFGYATNSFFEDTYDKYVSIDTLDDSQYLITYNQYNPILDTGSVKVNKIIAYQQNTYTNFHHYYVFLNADSLSNNDTFVGCFEYGYNVDGTTIGDDMYIYLISGGQTIGYAKAMSWKQDAQTVSPGIYRVKIESITDSDEGTNATKNCKITFEKEWEYPENSGITYNTSDINQIIFPQTAYKLYSYFVDSIPEQFFYYRSKQEIELEYTEAFAGTENVMVDGSGEVLWESVYNEAVCPINIQSREKFANESIVGGTIVWNQLVDKNTSDVLTTDHNVTFVDNRDGTYTVSTTAEGASADTFLKVSYGAGNTVIDQCAKGNHKYYIAGCPTGGSRATYCLATQYVTQICDTGNGKIWAATNQPYTTGGFRINIAKGTIITTPLVFKPQFFDLTQMFGSTIADYVYSLEGNNTGAGIAWFRKLFPNPCYAYDAGTLMSVNTSAHIIGNRQYNLNASVVLNGWPYLDEDNNLMYDGDVWTSDGKILRKYETVAITHWEQIYGTDYWTFTPDVAPKVPSTSSEIPKIKMRQYVAGSQDDALQQQGVLTVVFIGAQGESPSFKIRLDQYPSLGVCVYERQTPEVQEDAPTFENPQIFTKNAICKYVDAAYEAGQRDVAIPVGHITKDATQNLIVRDIRVTAKLSNTSVVPFAIPNIKSYRYYLYGKLDDQEERLLEDSGLLYDGKMTYTFYGLDSIYAKSYNINFPYLKENGKILYYLDFICEDEYGHIYKKTNVFYATYFQQLLDLENAKIAGRVDCLTQSANLTAHLTSNFNDWCLYKNKYNDFYETYLGTYNLDPELYIQDYQVKNGEAYQYTLWKKTGYRSVDNRYIYGVYSTIGAIRSYWQDWSLCDLVYDYENKMYIPGDTIFLFQKNINAGGINKNISRVQYETLSRYNRILSNSSKYDSGNLTCLFGDFKVAQKITNNMPIVTIYGTVPIIDGQTKESSFLQIINSRDISIAQSFFGQNGLYPGMNNIYLDASYKNAILYVEDLGLYYSRKYTPQWVEMQSMYQLVSDPEKITAFQNCLANKQKKLLKAPNGSAWIVAISGGVSREIDWKSGQYPTNVSFEWQEVDDIDSVKILKW